MKTRMFAVLVAALSLLIGSVAVQAQPNPLLVGNPRLSLQKYVPDEIVVKFRDRASASALSAAAAKVDGTIDEPGNHRGFRVMKIKSGKSVEQLAALLRTLPDVETAEPNYYAYASMIPNDPYYAVYQWNFHDAHGIRMPAAWDVSTGSSGIVIGVIGTGVAYENYDRYAKAPDLAGALFVAGYDFINNDAHPNDDEGHETHVCGTIAQTTNNGIGVAGIAYNCAIMPVKVLGSNGSGPYTAVANGIIWAADHGAKVINLSLGGPAASILEDACAYAYNQGVTVVAAAGNENGAISYPAAYDAYCIAVGATRFDETRSYYSNFGASLDIAAPGGDVNVDQNGDGYADGILQQTFDAPKYKTFGYYFYQGTSMATPHVTGVAALLLSAGVATTPDEVREALTSTARDIGAPGWDPEFGWGLLDAAAALNYAAVQNTPPVAHAGASYAGTEDQPVTFDGSQSSDADGDQLTYAWKFGDGTSGSGVTPSHAYTAGGDYVCTLVVNDGKVNSAIATAPVYIDEVNDAPVASAGPDQAALVNQSVALDGSASYDIDGSIVSYAWDFGDGTSGSGATAAHSYAAAGTYIVTLTVTDDGGLQSVDQAVVTVTLPPVEITVFTDGFEVGEWNGTWTEDKQNDWFRSSQRATEGSWSAEVDGSASNAAITSVAIDLQGKTTATISFDWLIESGLDAGEYVSFEVSTNGGSTWSEKFRIKGNVDPENAWQSKAITLTGIANLKLRFKGKMSAADEDANVDNVKVVVK